MDCSVLTVVPSPYKKIHSILDVARKRPTVNITLIGFGTLHSLVESRF